MSYLFFFFLKWFKNIQVQVPMVAMTTTQVPFLYVFPLYLRVKVQYKQFILYVTAFG